MSLDTRRPFLARTLPPEQWHAFNQYIDLINKANPVLGHLITALYHQAREIELGEAWLIDLTLWQEHIDKITRAVDLAVKEQITQSVYDAKLAGAQTEWVPVEEIAAFLASYRADWQADDDEESESGSEPVIKDEAWGRAAAEETKKLRSLVADGTLPSRGKGKAMKLRSDAVCHFGHDVGVDPEDYLAYRVVPDNQAVTVAQELDAIRHLQGSLNWRAFDTADSGGPAFPEKIRSSLRESIAHQLITTWIELRCVDCVLAEIGEEFNDLDPLRPVLRQKAGDRSREAPSHGT